MELHARDERAVLVGHDGAAEREVDPHSLALGADLSDALHEWAKVVGAVRRSDTADESAGIVVSQRGRQLATRVADAMGQPINYIDPLSGEVSLIEPPEIERPAPPPPPKRAEPTPWSTGLAVSAFVFVFVVVAINALAATLMETSPLLGVASNVVITAGLLPSVWLARGTPTLRWLAYGTAAGIAVGWVSLPFILFA
ncbi:hypothetical protein [Alloactinosynnema sp. L-07]|uniref:DUF2537 domain-containing protein n=1 Tax=Alloactinosynnema sp. L-07 TaxID=1653480 RepID=UPI00065F01C9|nr:DUF2537 domain-containing protein [Alloactinosynnema sp. L-07]CRK61322.1 hypothetical protein [Alloactinosynnema sp. L-07]